MNASVIHPAAVAFDSIADEYDQVFTRSVIGKAQRAQVWRAIERTFRSGDRVLELNCGTGEDALFMARRGISVFATDASGEMIRSAKRRHLTEAADLPVKFEQIAIESLASIGEHNSFEGAVSNFSGLNCVADLRPVACELARLLVPGASALFCISARICAWETLWYIARGDARRAFRRWPGAANAVLKGHEVEIHYPTVRKMCRAFAPWFALRSIMGVGILVPPSYAESWARQHTRSLTFMSKMDRLLCHIPGIRTLGDHVLLHLERTVEA
jgi:SAM-dependent methyltransferase